MTVKVKRGCGTVSISFSLNNKRDMKTFDRWLEEGKKKEGTLLDAAERAGIPINPKPDTAK